MTNTTGGIQKLVIRVMICFYIRFNGQVCCSSSTGTGSWDEGWAGDEAVWAAVVLFRLLMFLLRAIKTPFN